MNEFMLYWNAEGAIENKKHKEKKKNSTIMKSERNANKQFFVRVWCVVILFNGDFN